MELPVPADRRSDIEESDEQVEPRRQQEHYECDQRHDQVAQVIRDHLHVVLVRSVRHEWQMLGSLLHEADLHAHTDTRVHTPTGLYYLGRHTQTYAVVTRVDIVLEISASSGQSIIELLFQIPEILTEISTIYHRSFTATMENKRKE